MYTYNSVYDFLHSQDAVNPTLASAYTNRYSAVSGSYLPYAQIKASVFSGYAQDKVNLTDNFKLTYGVRLDFDAFPTTLAYNQYVPSLTFQGGVHVDPSILPKNRLQVSPRIGFNWDVNGDQTTQVRGGTGLFTGLVPFVWISNQASNNGLLFGSQTTVKTATSTAANTPALVFNPNVDANRPSNGAANTSYELDVADPNLKYPKIWRTNLAIDHKLPGGVVATIEGAYTKDINAIYHQNLVLSDTYTTLAGPEGQIQYDKKNITPATGSPQSASNPAITGLYYMKNTSAGFSWFATAQLQKSFSNGLLASIAYTHTVSKDVNDGGSTASTIWSSRPVAGNPNLDNLSNSTYVIPNRIIATLAYKKEYFKNAPTTFGLVFESQTSGALSYITSGDPNNDSGTNDLMYIPANKGDILLVPNGATDTRTPDQLWAQLNNFISQDPYLSKHRGQYAERNGAILPYYNRFDFHFAQDFSIMAGKTKNTLEITFDVINVGNMLNRNWGQYYTSFTGVSSGTVQVLKYMGTTTTALGKQAQYSFPYLDATNNVPVTTSYKTDLSQLSRFQAQIGVRYIFN